MRQSGTNLQLPIQELEGISIAAGFLYWTRLFLKGSSWTIAIRTPSRIKNRRISGIRLVAINSKTLNPKTDNRKIYLVREWKLIGQPFFQFLDRYIKKKNLNRLLYHILFTLVTNPETIINLTGKNIE